MGKAYHHKLRRLYLFSKSIDYTNLLSQLSLDTIKERQLFQSLVHIFRASIKRFPPIIVTINIVSGSCLNQSAPRSCFQHCTFSYINSRLWNSLQQEVRDARGISNFRSKFKKFKLDDINCKCTLSAFSFSWVFSPSSRNIGDKVQV